ncbi:yhiS [Escherichia coli]|nr:yhiS [Escherichia coli]
MSIDFTPGIINTYHGDIYNCTTNTDNVKTQTHRSGLVIIGKNNNPLIPYSLEKDTTLNNLI